MDAFWTLCAELIRRWHLWLLAGAVVATVTFAFGITRLEFKTSQDTFVPSGSQVFQDNVRYEQQFGGEPVLVLFTADDIRQLFAPPNIGELAALEEELRASELYHSVFGPLALLQFAQDQIPVAAELAPGAIARLQNAATEAARAEAAATGASEAEQENAAQDARDAATEAYSARVAADARRLAAAGEQSLDNPQFVDFLIFDEAGAIRPEFTGIFPDPQHALMVVRLNGNMSIDEQGDAVRADQARDDILNI